MYILGISCFYHDSAACLLKDGDIVSAIQEERFTRIKHDNSFPSEAIRHIIKKEGISINEIEKVVFYEKPFLKFERILETYLAKSPKGLGSFIKSMPVWSKEKLFQKKIILKELRKFNKKFDINKILFGNHHLSHAASAFYPSPFENSLILTFDGVGEWSTTTIAEGNKNEIKLLREIKYPHSLGLLYSAFTYYLGFKVNSGEYKLMGLAPYGKPIYVDLILNNLIDLKSDGSFRLNQKFFNYSEGLTMINDKFSNLFNKSIRKPGTDIDNTHMDIAASIQKVLEIIIIKICKSLKNEYGYTNLCLAGGVALNCVINGKLKDENIFQNIWIQPASGDAGGALGAAYSYWYFGLKKNRDFGVDKMKGSYLGPQFNNIEVEQSLKNCSAVYESDHIDSIIELTVKNLKKGFAIGWFQGAMEFGPRALGNRSIIADPRSIEMQSKLNMKIKFRESFRPFAPAILFEDLSDWFELKDSSPYMLLVSKVKKEHTNYNENDKDFFGIERLKLNRSSIPAVTHVDYTARIQTIHEETNPIFYNLVKKFKEETGCPILVNTSFNVRGEPLVCSPEDAFRCFMGTNLDILVINNFILEKTNQKVKFDYGFKNRYELD